MEAFLPPKEANLFKLIIKERMVPEDMYALSENETILSSPSPKLYPYKPPMCSDCAPLFTKIEAYPRTMAVLVLIMAYMFGETHGSVLKLRFLLFMNGFKPTNLLLFSNQENKRRGIQSIQNRLREYRREKR